MFADLRLALRTLARTPAFAAAAVLCIALGIGANTAIFSVVDAVLLRPLPVRGLDRMVVIREDLPGLNLLDTSLDPPSSDELIARRDLFDGAAAFQSLKLNLNLEGTEPARVGVARTMGGFFELLGARPAAGRLYGADQSRDGHASVVVLSYALWKGRFGGDPAVVGKTVRLNGRDYEVVGVAGADVRYPRTADLWAPYPIDTTFSQQRGRLMMTLVGRRRADVGPERLQAELVRVVRGWDEAAGQSRGSGAAAFESKMQRVLRPVPLVDYLAGELRPIVVMLVGAVAFVLLIACANVACLQLVRATGRVRELAVRAALGAAPGRLVRPLLSESALIAALGGALGVGIGALAVYALGHWGPAEYPMLGEASLHPAVLAFSALATVAAALLFGVAPAMRAARVDPQDALRGAGAHGVGGRGSSAGVDRHRFLHGAVVVQMALALTLLLMSGLMIRSLARLIATDPGIRPQRVLTAQLALPFAYFEAPAQREAFVDGMLERLRATPGVQSAGIAAYLPFGGYTDSSPFEIPGRPVDASGPHPHAEYNLVSEGYFAAMGVRLLAGRGFTTSDVRGGAPVVVVDEQLAKEFFPGENPIGRRIKQLWVGNEDPVIVGVVGTVKQNGLARPDKATIYYSFRQNTPSAFAVSLRGTLPPATFTSAVRAAVAAQDPRIPVYDVRLMAERVEESLGARRLAVWVLAAFAALALTLAVLGISGVLSYAVSQRTRELGIRVALGARPDAIVGMVVRRGATLAAIGLVAGTALFLATGRLVASALYGVGPRDPLTIAAAASLLAGVALLASWLPARRAARTDALTALRME